MTLLPFLCRFFLSSLLLLMSPASCRRNGLTIQLIHRDSPASPLHSNLANLTSVEKLQRLIHQSNTRINYLLSTKTNIHPQMIRPTIDLTQLSTYLVNVGIGTFDANFNSPKVYYLHMDRGSELTWTQCAECPSPGHHCFPQKDPPFPNTKSKSYKPLPCKQHPLCLPNQCIGDSCSINMSFMDGSSIVSILANETFTFDSGTPETIPEIAFSCTIDSTNMDYGGEENLVTGIFGLGWGPRSFLTQIDSLSHGRFSYCLKTDDGHDLNTYLRFGEDIPAEIAGSQTTTLLHLKDWQACYISLLGISVNAQRLNINPTQFVLRHNRSGGCIIDSGSTFTHLIRPAYSALISNLEEHFSGSSNLNRIEGAFDLCYLRLVPEGYDSLPIMTFHLRNNANLEIGPEQMFYVGKQ